MDFLLWANPNFGTGEKKTSRLKREEKESIVNHNNLGKYGELNFNASLCIYIRTGSHTEKY
jgi:hypothetical protein